jgi:hypothetical protein
MKALSTAASALDAKAVGATIRMELVLCTAADSAAGAAATSDASRTRKPLHRERARARQRLRTRKAAPQH